MYNVMASSERWEEEEHKSVWFSPTTGKAVRLLDSNNQQKHNR